MPGNGELRLLVNPQGLDAGTGAGFLTRCFGSPWSAAMYRWYLERPFGGELPDRLMLMDRERAVAACGVAYRLLRTPDGATHPAGIVVSAATLPGERGRGCYAHLLHGAIARSAQRGCTALLAFVTADNTSCRGLRRLGAIEIASAYIASHGPMRSAGSGTLRLADAAVPKRWPARATAYQRARPPRVVFHYPDARDWASQMMERPNPVQPLRIGSTCRALIECAGDTDRLQWLDGDPRERRAAICAIAALARRRGRRFFMYSMRTEDIEGVRRLGLVTRPGCLMALAPRPDQVATVRGWAALSWDVQSGDRM